MTAAVEEMGAATSASIERILRDCRTIENLHDLDPQPSAAEWQAFVAHALASPSAECANALGSCYYCGVGVAEASQDAARCFRLAAEQGHALAQCKLGWCYEIGEGVDADMAEAVRLGINPIVTLGKQLLIMIVNLV